MRNIINLMPLTKQLRAKAGDSTIVIATLQDAGSYIQNYGRPAFHWQTAAVAIERADTNPRLIKHATRSMENALRTDQLLV
jgi:hypothetical protein